MCRGKILGPGTDRASVEGTYVRLFALLGAGDVGEKADETERTTAKTRRAARALGDIILASRY